MNGFLKSLKNLISHIIRRLSCICRRFCRKKLSLHNISKSSFTMNENIAHFLDEYMLNPDPQYAVMLTGRWGCGKTFFINNWLDTINIKGGDREEVIYLRPIYVSVFGMSSLNEVKTEIDRKVNPFYYSKTAKVLKTAAKFASKIIFKTDLTVSRDIKATASGSLDVMSLFESNSDEVSGTRFIVFDDIERSNIPLKLLLGFIHFFVDRCKFHVVIIGDDSKFNEYNKKIFDEFKEKTIGRQFEIQSDVESALDSYIEDYKLEKFIVKEREYIIKCFRATTYNNLRLLRQCMYDFNEVLKGFNKKKVKENSGLFHCLLSSFIAVYAEYNSPEHHSTMVNWNRLFPLYNASFKDDQENECYKIEKKYKDVSEGNMYPATFYTFVNGIVDFLSKGCCVKALVETLFPTSEVVNTIQSKFDGFFNLSNEEFNKRYDEVEKSLLEGKILDGNQLGAAIGYIGYFDVIEVRAIKKEVMNCIKDTLSNLLPKINNMKDLLKFKTAFLYGYRYVSMSTDKEMPTKEIVEDFQKELDKHLSQLCDDRQMILRSLSDENVNVLSDLENESYPDHSRAYSLVPVFEKENAAMLFDKICRLSNKGRYVFRDFLEMHYELGSKVDHWKEYFKPDASVLATLYDRLKDVSQSKESIERLSYRDLLKTLENVIKRCNGEI